MKTPTEIRRFLGAPPAALIAALAAFMLLGLALLYPLGALLSQSFRSQTGEWAGLANLRLYFHTPGLAASFYHTLWIGLGVTALTVIPAFVLAFSLTHTRAAGRRLTAALSLLPLFAPSIFPALGLIYLFGDQGPLKFLLGGRSLYGPLGLVLGGVIFGLPQAVMLLSSALMEIDPALYAAARSLGAGPWRRFFTVTCPGARYGLVNAAVVVFLLTITDFGVPKVLGGDYSVLATEVFKQVVGQQNFNMGAAVSLVLLLPAVGAFALDSWARRGQTAFSGPRRPLVPAHRLSRDIFFTLAGWVCLVPPLAVMAMVVWGSVIGFWPYDLNFTWANYAFDATLYGLKPFGSSLVLAFSVACLGTGLIFGASYILTRWPPPGWLAGPYRLMALTPLVVPGTVLGLAYILAFNRPALDFFYGSMAIMVVNSIIHFYSVGHLAFCGGLARLDLRYERVGGSLGQPPGRTFRRVIIPLQKHIILEVAFYFFINALTTVSAVIFIYSPATAPASVAILQMFDSGQIAEAAAMGTVILLISLAARGLLVIFNKSFTRSEAP